MKAVLTCINLGVGMAAAVGINDGAHITSNIYRDPTVVLPSWFLHFAVILAVFATIVLLDAKPSAPVCACRVANIVLFVRSFVPSRLDCSHPPPFCEPLPSIHRVPQGTLCSTTRRRRRPTTGPLSATRTWATLGPSLAPCLSA